MVKKAIVLVCLIFAICGYPLVAVESVEGGVTENSDLDFSVYPQYIGSSDEVTIGVSLDSFQQSNWQGCQIIIKNKNAVPLIFDKESELTLSFVGGPMFTFTLNPFELEGENEASIIGLLVPEPSFDERNILKMGVVMLRTLIELFPTEMDTIAGINMMNDVVTVNYNYNKGMITLVPYAEKQYKHNK